MAIGTKSVRNGFCYVTSKGQHRVVLDIVGGKVAYMSRGRQPGPWSIGHTLKTPPSLSTFAGAVEKRVSPVPPDAKKYLAKLRKVVRG